MKSRWDLIGAALGWGAQHSEAAKGPQALKALGVCALLEEQGATWQMCKAGQKPPDRKMRLNEIVKFNQMLAQQVAKSVQQGGFPCVLGGDHAIAVGTWSGLVDAHAAYDQFGLIWIDAHMDAHTPETSLSHNIHGMPVAALLGHGAPALVNLVADKRKLNPQHLVLIGIRSFEPAEQRFLAQQNVRVYLMEEVKKRGFAVVFAEALKKVTHQTKGFGISVDLDAFDPSIAPGTGAPVKGGLYAREVCQALTLLADYPQLKGLEIAEYDPTRDIDNKTAKLAQKILLTIKDST